MQLVILGLLLPGPLSLYDVRKRFTDVISLFYSASFGSIQNALRRLVDAGSVTVADDSGSGRRRKLYTITAAGRAAWHEQMLAPVQAGSDVEAQVLARVHMLGYLDDATDRLRVLDAAHDSAAAGLARLRALEAGHKPEDEHLHEHADEDEHGRVARYQWATLDYGLRAHELMVRWLDELRANRGTA